VFKGTGGWQDRQEEIGGRCHRGQENLFLEENLAVLREVGQERPGVRSVLSSATCGTGAKLRESCFSDKSGAVGVGWGHSGKQGHGDIEGV
jgi:hypothetical protein